MLWNNRYVRIDFSKNSKFFYYFHHVLVYIVPNLFYRRRLAALLEAAQRDPEVQARVHYYNRCNRVFRLPEAAVTLNAFRREKKKTYFFDLFSWWRFFRPEYRSAYLFGDIVHVPEVPTLVKSRPVGGENANSVLMNLNRVRHFIFVDDPVPFEAKKPMAVWRGKAYREHRMQFVRRYYDHPLCDIGQTNTKVDTDAPWQKPRMSLKAQLHYKFIVSIEGNDVASNLKWIMSSNSLAFMAKPKYETWFMEGTLIPDVHYVMLKDDYSDLEAKIAYYNEHTEEALAIIRNAHRHVARFRDRERETAISLSVMQKYFEQSGQWREVRERVAARPPVGRPVAAGIGIG